MNPFDKVCPKCGGVLVRRVFREQVFYYCGGCVRGYPESLLRAVGEEVGMTFHLCDDESKEEWKE